MVTGIGAARHLTDELESNMANLGEKAKDIGRIIGMITDIADQTNLLALNAAIEAARAGEAGRGFAVVADEVRKLAEKTMAATSQVSQAVSSIQEETRSNMDGVIRAAAAMQQVAELASSSGQALTEIVNMAENVADQVRGIATASEEQSAVSEQISASSMEINRISLEVGDHMRQSADMVSELVGQSLQLRQLMETLRMEAVSGQPQIAALEA